MLNSVNYSFPLWIESDDFSSIHSSRIRVCYCPPERGSQYLSVFIWNNWMNGEIFKTKLLNDRVRKHVGSMQEDDICFHDFFASWFWFTWTILSVIHLAGYSHTTALTINCCPLSSYQWDCIRFLFHAYKWFACSSIGFDWERWPKRFETRDILLMWLKHAWDDHFKLIFLTNK